MISLRSRNVRTRLTVWLVAVLAAVLVLYISIVFAFQYALLTNQIYHDEVQDVETVEGLLAFDSSGALTLRQDYHSHPQSRLLTDRLMEVRDLSGAVLYRSETLHGMTLGGPFSLHEGTTSFDRREVRIADGTRVLLISHRHPVQGRVVLIRLGYSLTPLWERMTVFLSLLMLALPVTLLIAGYAGYRVAKGTLMPLYQMASRAEQITASNLHDRLELENEHDELGYMGRVVNHLLDRLEQSFLQLQRFTADAAHELRTPLASIRSIGELALSQEIPQSVHGEAISSMLEETARLNQTIEGLLLLARAETIDPSDKMNLNLPDLVNESVDLLDAVLAERSMSVRQSGWEDGFGQVFVERAFVRATLLNVVHNAVKFAPDGSTILVIYAQHMREDTLIQSVAIQDAGPGVPAAERMRVFDRFYTGARKQGNGKAGSGLGLSIAKLAIERNHGRIYFEDVPVGTVCCIELPVSPI